MSTVQVPDPLLERADHERAHAPQKESAGRSVRLVVKRVTDRQRDEGRARFGRQREGGRAGGLVRSSWRSKRPGGDERLKQRCRGSNSLRGSNLERQSL